MNLIPSVIRKEPGKRPTAVRIARTLGLLPGLLLTLPAAVQAQFTYRTNHGTIAKMLRKRTCLTAPKPELGAAVFCVGRASLPAG